MSETSLPNSLLTQPAVLALIASGARDGQVTYDQINDVLIDLQLDEDDVEGIFDALEKRAIAVVDPTPDEKLIALAAQKLQVAAGTAPAASKKKKKAKAEAVPDDGLLPIPLFDGMALGHRFGDSDDNLDDLDSLLAELDSLIPDDVVSDLVATAGDDVDDNQAPVEDALKLYLNRMGQVPRLSQAEERALGREMKSGTPDEQLAAKNKLVEANLRLVVHLASQAAPRTTLSITDLLQEGNLGLMDAADHFKPDGAKPFGSTATWWIRRSLNRAINDNARSLTLSGDLFLAIQSVQKGQRELTAKLGRGPSRLELAAHTGLTVPQIEEAEKAAARPLSLDAHIGGGEEGTEFGETLHDPLEELAEQASDRRELREGLAKVLEELPERERNILQMRYGMGPHAEVGALAAEDVAKRLGLSRERIHELELRAIRKMRKKAKSAGLDPSFDEDDEE